MSITVDLSLPRPGIRHAGIQLTWLDRLTHFLVVRARIARRRRLHHLSVARHDWMLHLPQSRRGG